MATKKTSTPNDELPEPGDVTGEETEPEPFVDPAGAYAPDDDDVNGIEGQIIYPDREVDAEHAAAFAAGKEPSLYPDDEDGSRSGWQNPADRSTEVTTPEEDTSSSSSSTNPNVSKSNE